MDSEEAQNTSWYVIHCKPSRETLAAITLRNHLDLESYVPLALRKSRGQDENVVLFPGYIFVRADLGVTAPSSINASPGVLRLLAFSNVPQPVAGEIINALRQQLELLNSGGGLPTHNFQPGDTVQIKSGPLRGLSAIFTGPTTPGERVRVLLKLLGREHEVQLAVEDLEESRTAPVPRPPRRTRGKGRNINNARPGAASA